MSKKKNPDGERCKRALPFKLSDREKAEKGELAAKLNKQLEQAMDLRKREMAKHNERVKDLTSKISRILTAIDDGVERREVSCVEHKNFEKNLVEYYFEGIVLESREMKPEDRQLDLAEKKASKKAPRWQKLAPKYNPKEEKTEDEKRDEEIASVHKLETSKSGASSMVDPR